MNERNIFRRKGSPYWWISYFVHGRRFRKSTKTTSISKARRIYDSEVSLAREAGSLAGHEERVTYEQMRDLIVEDYERRQQGVRNLSRPLKRLDAYFAGKRAVDIQSAQVSKYISGRIREKNPARATINRELAALRRMFNLAVNAKLLNRSTPPKISTPDEQNRRKGFFERAEFESVLKYLPPEIQPIIRMAYITGWRVESEILTRKIHHVDLDAGWLRLEPGESKNGDGRNFPLTTELKAVLESVIAETRRFERETGRIVPWLFHRKGERIKNFREAWNKARRLAGLPGKLLHDFRRTAVRNLERAGVPRSAAMAMVGHRTVSMYLRYAISDESSLKEAAVKMDSFSRDSRSPQTQNRHNASTRVTRGDLAK